MVQITYLSADQVQQAPRKYGIYAWYYLPNFNTADAEELWDEISKAENKKKTQVAKKWLIDNYYKKYWLFLDCGEEHGQELQIKEGWMNITPSIKIAAKVTRHPNITEKLLELMCEDQEFLGQYLENLGKSSTLPFLSPIYIGMAEKGDSHIRKRLMKHLEKLEKAQSYSQKKLLEKFKPGSKTGEFANRAAIAGISKSQLWFATFPVRDTDHEKMPHKLENLLNRLTTPSLGSN